MSAEQVRAISPGVEVFNVSRTEVAHRRHGKALERVQGLGDELRAAFEELYSASEQLAAVGVDATVKLAHPLDEAWAGWRSKRFLQDPHARPGR